MDIISQALDALIGQWSYSFNWTNLVIFVALPTTGFLTARYTNNHRGYLFWGPGGLPSSQKGHINNLSNNLLASNDTRSLDRYSDHSKYAIGCKQASENKKSPAQKSFLTEPLKQRVVDPEVKDVSIMSDSRLTSTRASHT